jgi:hypothetical protein
MKYRTIVAIENLKKVSVKGGINGDESFAAINAPAQKIVQRTIRKYILAFDMCHPPSKLILSERIHSVKFIRKDLFDLVR